MYVLTQFYQCIELNNLVWAFARLGHKSERSETLFSGVAEQLVKRTWHFKPQDIGTTLWSFATAEFYDQDAFRAGAARLNFRQIRSFKVRFVSKEIDMYLSCIHVVLLSNILSILISTATGDVKYSLGLGNSWVRPGTYSSL